MTTPTPITLDKITVASTTGDWKTVKADNKITKNVTPVANQIIDSGWKDVKTKKAYDKITTGVSALTTTVDWHGYDATRESTEVWHTKVFKEKYKKSGSTKQYYRQKSITYLYKQRFRYYDSEYTFAKQPKSITITYQDLDIEDDNVGTDVGRDRTTGKITRNRVRTNVRTIECEFPPLTHAEVNAMMPYLNAENSFSGFLKLTFTDAYQGTKTITCYAGDRSFEAGPFGWWLNGKVTFVEQ